LPAPDLWLAACLAGGGFAGWTAARATRVFVDELAASWRLEAAMAAAGAVLFAWAWAVTPMGLVLIASLALAFCLLTLTAVDISAFRLPDLITLPLTAAGLLLAWRLPAADGLMDHLAGSLAGYGVLALVAWGFRRLRGQEGIGMGDAKLMAAAGAWLGWQALPSVLLLGCGGGLLWWSVGRLLKSDEPRIPFGAPLCAGIWLVWLYGPLQLAPTAI
jgi:leader peptidase (prepilin peptidase)/N-methyltransferase